MQIVICDDDAQTVSSLRDNTPVVTGALLLTLALRFAGAAFMPDRRMPDTPARMNAINIVFFLCLPPCFGWYCYALKASRQKKLFIFAFTLRTALSRRTICSGSTPL